MDRVDELKGKARELERSGQPRSALEVYLRLGRQGETGGSGALWARIGDLQLQMGDSLSAAESYTRATELFTEAGQTNNAIAVTLRRIEANGEDPLAHLTLGELSLKQGYRDYARSGLSVYTRHAVEQGRPAEVVGAFTAFTDRFPSETRLWKEWVGEMQELGRAREAVEVLRQFWEHLSEGGATSVAEGVRDLILDVDPSADPAPAPRRPPVRNITPPPADTEPLPLVGYELPEAPSSAAIAPLAGLEPTHADVEWGELSSGSASEDAPHFLDASSADPAAGGAVELPYVASATDDLPLLGVAPLDDLEATGPESSYSFEDSPLIDSVPEHQAAEDLPLLGSEPEGILSISSLQQTLADTSGIVARIRSVADRPVEPSDGSTHYDLGIAYKEMGLGDESLAHLAAALEKGHDPVATVEVVGEILLERGAADIARGVLEAATELEGVSESSQLGIKYWRGRCAEALGEEASARTLYRQVAEADPDFRDARSRLDSGDF